MSSIVVNGDGNRVEFVNVVNGKPEGYELKKGERLVDDLTGMNMVKPKYINGEWVETATAEEIKNSKPKSEPVISPQDLVIAELIDMVVQSQMQTDMALAEIIEMVGAI